MLAACSIWILFAATNAPPVVYRLPPFSSSIMIVNTPSPRSKSSLSSGASFAKVTLPFPFVSTVRFGVCSSTFILKLSFPAAFVLISGASVSVFRKMKFFNTRWRSVWLMICISGITALLIRVPVPEIFPTLASILSLPTSLLYKCFIVTVSPFVVTKLSVISVSSPEAFIWPSKISTKIPAVPPPTWAIPLNTIFPLLAKSPFSMDSASE